MNYMEGAVIQSLGNRLLCQDDEGHFFVCKARARSDGRVSLKDYIVVPSFMFGMSLLMENNPDEAVDSMLRNYKKGWTW